MKPAGTRHAKCLYAILIRSGTTDLVLELAAFPVQGDVLEASVSVDEEQSQRDVTETERVAAF